MYSVEMSFPAFRVYGLDDMEGALEGLFSSMITDVRLREDLTPESKVQVIITDGSMTVYTHMRYLREMTGARVLDYLEAALQSEEFLELGSTKVIVKYSKPIAGGAYLRGGLEPEEFLKKKKCIVRIPENDQHQCFFECLAIALEYIRGSRDDRKRMCRVASVRRARAEELMGGRQFPDGVSLDMMGEYERKLNVGINVVDLDTGHFLRVGSNVQPFQAYLLWVSERRLGHYHYITSPGAYFQCRHFCRHCMRGHQNMRHACLEKCICCESVDCEYVGYRVKEFAFTECMVCRRVFFSEECKAKHRCNEKRRCVECDCVHFTRDEHRCHERVCSNCKEWVFNDEDHKCYIQRIEESKEPNDKLIFYDFECCIGAGNQHIPTLVVAGYLSGALKVFRSLESFMDWVLAHRGYTLIAHNASRYDAHFVKKELIRRRVQTSDVVDGNTIFCSEYKAQRLRFIDSCKFIPMALRKFPQTFGIVESKKGYFPYKFYTEENRFYKGRIPDAEWFEFAHMNPKDKAAGEEWYREHSGAEYDIDKECVEYCKSDVLVLREGCARFRQLFLELSDQHVDPFNYMTIASVCMAIYRTLFMPEATIGILGSNPHQEEWETQRAMQMYDEKQVMYCKCIDRGCPECYARFTRHPTSFKYMHELYTETRREARGRKLLWECQVPKRVEGEDPEEPLRIRDAFFGGRVEPVKLYWKGENGVTAEYVDFTSLYPTVQSCKWRGTTPETYREIEKVAFPIGHPVYIRNPSIEDLDKYFGFVKCSVVPPQDLYFPILPERRDGKLMFDLKPKTGTWTTHEVQVARQHGYRVTRVYEVCHFEQQSDELFRSYVRKFLKVKTEAAGWAKLGCVTEEAKREFLEEFQREEGIELEYDRVGESLNAGLYFVAKLCLNSLWGKLGQRAQFSTTTDTFERGAYDKIVHADEHEIQHVIMHDQVCRTVTYKKRVDFAGTSPNTNIAIACYVTAFARIKLWQVIHRLGRRVLYMDTDSVIFANDKPGLYCCGRFLGDLTNELDDGDSIVEFVSTGPKCYAYRTARGKVEMKLKGFTLNSAAKRVLSFDLMKKLVYQQEQEAIVEPLRFIIDRQHGIRTEVQPRRYRFTFDKRVIRVQDNMIDTEPHC